MIRLFRLFAAIALAAATPALAQEGGSSGAYAIDGIAVDVVAANPEAARTAAFRIAQRKAWPLLWSRLTGGPLSAAPRLSDGQLDSIVSGIESQGERFSMTRYIARLGVVFDRSRSADYFAGSGAALQSPPMLLLPLYSDGGIRTLYQSKTPWRAAWQRFREKVTPLDYILASGSAGDNILLTNWQVMRPDRPSWRNILNRYDAVDVLTAEARLTRGWPGGPIAGLFIARHGPDATELARFTLVAADDSELDAMLDNAVRQTDEIYAVALRSGRLRREPDLNAEMAPIMIAAPLIGAPEPVAAPGQAAAPAISSFEAVMATPDAATAASLEAIVRAAPGVTTVTVTSLSLGGTSRLIISHAGSRDALASALDARGLRLENQNGQMVLRRRAEGETPLPVLAPASDVPALPPPAPAPSAPVPTAPAGAPPVPQPRTPGTRADPPTDAPAGAPVDLVPGTGA